MENNEGRDKKSSRKKEDSDDESSESKDSSESKSIFGETLKKVFAAGVTAAFMTEENVRAHLSDLKLPKEFLNLLLQQANKSKEELVQRVGKEIINMMGKIDFVTEFSKFAETHKFKISAEIEVVKKDKHS